MLGLAELRDVKTDETELNFSNKTNKTNIRLDCAMAENLECRSLREQLTYSSTCLTDLSLGLQRLRLWQLDDEADSQLLEHNPCRMGV